MTDWKTIERIKELFELTEYEAKIFAVLVKEGTGVIPNRLTRLSKVPRVKVYTICYNLAEKGFVQVIPRNDGHLTQFKARPKAEIFEMLRERNAIWMRRVSTGLREIYQKARIAGARR
jgi:sugar-specific transcriptional regulator TrmB